MFTIVIVLIIAVAAAVLFLELTQRTVRRALQCPVLGTDVEVQVRETLPEGRPIDVTACSALKPPTNVVCRQRCLGLLTRAAMRPAAKAVSSSVTENA